MVDDLLAFAELFQFEGAKRDALRPERRGDLREMLPGPAQDGNGELLVALTRLSDPGEVAADDAKYVLGLRELRLGRGRGADHAGRALFNVPGRSHVAGMHLIRAWRF